MSKPGSSKSPVDIRYVDEFDGFMHVSRPFDPEVDGWRDTQLSEKDFPAIAIAQDILYLFKENNALRKKVWQLERDVEMWKTSAGFPSTTED